MNQYLVAIVVVALLALIIYRQMRTMPVQPRQLLVFPGILALIGIVNLSNIPPSSTGASTAFAVSVLSALIFGVARGVTTQVWRQGTVVLRRGGVLTLMLWIVSIAFRLAIAIVARHAGVSLKATTAELPVFLAVTLGAQNALIWVRGRQAEAGLSAGART